MKQFLKSDMFLYLIVLISAAVITLGINCTHKAEPKGELILEAPILKRDVQAMLAVRIVAIEGVKNKVKMIVYLGTCIKSREITLKQLAKKDELNKILHEMIDKEMESGECEPKDQEEAP